MDVPEFARLLKQKNPESEVWWDASPVACEAFKTRMKLKYPTALEYIDCLMPSHFRLSPWGLSGATTNPGLVSQEVLRTPDVWRHFIQAHPGGPYNDEAQVSRTLYDQVIIDGAQVLQPLWQRSNGGQGWLSAQVEGGDRLDVSALVARGLQLARLAPNIMVKVPGSEEGYRAIEALVAKGCSINNTLCFTVSQAAACLKAIHAGRLRAEVDGVDTRRARYVISFMIGRLGAEAEFERQARHRRLRLTPVDRRWAELAIYQAIQALMRRWQTPARVLLCSLKVDTDRRGREHCWHLQRTGADTTLYTLTPEIIEFLIRRYQIDRAVTPATEWVQVPRRVMNRLIALPYFNQAYFEGDLPPARFRQHPAFITAAANARQGHERLVAFVRASRAVENVCPASVQRPLERAS
ncbi:transaldolase family protein [Pseudomonas sp. GD03842]|uniref:transaldolase family protein n=1 Tax=Pseudomonas sp. GD03842 TaxID=2975385 RepID=UPI002446E119|nr:transaldolase family protein [Pseudomonas sp. GD03842]MDH0749595.1 transaldolase family protein [Pseudomonas sp. GD03842]